MVMRGDLTVEFPMEDEKTRKKMEEAVPLEEALELTGLGSYNWRLFVVSNCLLLAMVAEIFGVSVLVTASACDLRLTTHTKGLIAAMPMLGIVSSAHLWGWLADTRGRKTVLLVSMVGSWLFSIGSSFATEWPVLAVCKFISSFFASASNSVTYALFGECTPRSQRNKLVLMMSGGLMCGQGLIALLAYPVLSASFSYQMVGLNGSYRPWRLLQQVYGLVSLLGALLLLLLVKESPKFYASRGREGDCLRILREIFAINTRKHPDEYPVSSILFEESVACSKGKGVLQSLWEQTTPLLRPPLLTKTLIISYIVIVVYVVPPSFMMWMPTIANAFSRSMAAGVTGLNFCQMLQYERMATTHQSIANGTAQPPCVDTVENFTYYILIAFSCTLAVLNTLNSFLLRVVNKRSLVVFYHALTGACGFVLPWILNSTLSATLFFLFLMNVVCMGLTTSFTVEVYPTYLRAMAVCLTMMIGRGSSFLAISYVGVLMETHCDATFYAFGVFVLSGALVGLLLPFDEKHEQQKETDKT